MNNAIEALSMVAGIALEIFDLLVGVAEIVGEIHTIGQAYIAAFSPYCAVVSAHVAPVTSIVAAAIMPPWQTLSAMCSPILSVRFVGCSLIWLIPCLVFFKRWLRLLMQSSVQTLREVFRVGVKSSSVISIESLIAPVLPAISPTSPASPAP